MISEGNEITLVADGSISGICVSQIEASNAVQVLKLVKSVFTASRVHADRPEWSNCLVKLHKKNSKHILLEKNTRREVTVESWRRLAIIFFLAGICLKGGPNLIAWSSVDRGEQMPTFAACSAPSLSRIPGYDHKRRRQQGKALESHHAPSKENRGERAS